MEFYRLFDDQNRYGYEINQKPDKKEGWVKIKTSKKEFKVLNGDEVTTKITKYERYLSLASKQRIAGIALAALTVIGSLGLSLLSKSIRQLFTGRQVFVLTLTERQIREQSSAESTNKNESVSEDYLPLLEEMLADIEPASETVEKIARVSSYTQRKK